MALRCLTLNPLRLSRGHASLSRGSRLYHSAIAKFTTVGPGGIPVSHDTGGMIREPNENYVYIDPEVGNAIKSALVHQLGSGVTGHNETLALQFNWNGFPVGRLSPVHF